MTPVNPKVLESLSWGISAEVKAYVFYKEAAKVVKSAEFKDTLLSLAGEEKNHYWVLERAGTTASFAHQIRAVDFLQRYSQAGGAAGYQRGNGR